MPSVVRVVPLKLVIRGFTLLAADAPKNARYNDDAESDENRS
jgi:hypothetical protein